MRLDDLKLFTTVVQLGSFTAAANALDLPRANVSRRIGELEKQLNAQLFFRTTRKLRLTQHGDVFYQELLKAVDALERAQHALHQLDDGPVGKIKIGIYPDSDEIIQPLLTDFQAIYPDIELDVRLSNSALDDIYQQGLDIGFHLGQLKNSNLIARRLGQVARVLTASPDYIAQHGIPDNIQQLTKHHCLCFRWPDGMLEDNWLMGSQNIKVKPKLSSNSTRFLRQATLAGQGISLLPELLISKSIEAGELTAIHPELQSSVQDFWLVYPDRLGVSRASRLLIDCLLVEIPKIINITPPHKLS